ncbi:MAG: hypothetical protein JSW47_11540, partial [Phycisphaerales bacterium]
TEDFVRRGKTKVATNSQMDKRVLDDSFAVMDETVAGKSSVVRMILQSRAAKLAAAAVIIIAVGLLVNQSSPPEQKPPEIGNVAESPAEMLSVMSLNMAYRRGGMEAVDDVSDKAFKALGSKPDSVSLRELLTESNGV